MIFQTIIWSNRTHSLKYQRYTALESEDKGNRKPEFVAKTQFLQCIVQATGLPTKNKTFGDDYSDFILSIFLKIIIPWNYKILFF